ncbi:protein kinase [Rhodococcus sp. HM1]|uniref:protein kinase domain-containing protein n=1 Tax=Rhodococcus sp. HM1 TaxID=2937759 RepID=UPI00200B7F76|nr:serine/threonine-protein kinase [Rhodococcus sp. HM1]MCK8669644.1 protein kinase [Rhodococcus sp. HM1]
MSGPDPLSTQRDVGADVASELALAGFVDAYEIGRGGFGIVYRCHEVALDRTVAVKVLTSHLAPDNLERFLREQRAMGRLSGHPHIVNVMQVGTTVSGRPYLVMQYHRRDSLDARIRRTGPVGWEETLHLGVALAGALETAHRLGILHRDVKPANIMLTEFGEPQLTDFGIARIRGGFETVTGEITGSPAFTAPEVLAGHTPTPASDVYSLAATLFCALTGHAAFERRSGEKIVTQFVRVSTEPIPDLREEGVPDALCAAIEQAMSADPRDRPATAAEFGEQLREIQAQQGLVVDELSIAGASDHAHEPLVSGSTTGTSGRSVRRTGAASRVTTPPAPATRFRPPVPTRRLVARRRLLALLGGERRRRLIAVHAPPGFGKTMLALQWRYVLDNSGVPVAWLNVDRDDNNVVWFLTHLVEAFRQVRPELVGDLTQTLAEHGDEAERYVLTSLIDRIHAAGERVVIILDDWHRVTDRATVAAMGFLLDNCCRHLQVMVVGRTRAGLPMSRMRVREDLIEIDFHELRFSVQEAREFLVDQCCLALDDERVAALTAATDGWPAALQLASMSLCGLDDPDDFIAHLSGRHRDIGEFLTENVLASLEPELVDFLLTAAVTERTCGSLASALSGHERGQAMLEEIEERDLFLHRVDQEGRWFQFQPLFAEFLRQRLERDHPEQLLQLHRSASQWCEKHDMLIEAVDHALATGDDERAVDLVERNGRRLLENGRGSVLLGLVEKLPMAEVTRRPRLQLAIAWANVVTHRPQPGLRALGLVESGMASGAVTGEEAADMVVEVEVIRGLIDVRADRSGRSADIVEHCLARAETLPSVVVSTGLNTATFDAVYRGEFDEARRLQELARPYHELNAGPYNLMHGHTLLGLAAFEQLDVDTAAEHFRDALALSRRVGGRHSSAALLAGSVRGEFLYERGELDEAARLLDDGYALGAEGGVVDFKIARFVVGARIAAVRGNRDIAAERLRDGADAAASMHLDRLAAAVENERIRLDLSPVRRPRPVARYGSDRPESGTALLTAQIDDATAIRLLLSDPTAEHTDLACRWASEWVQRWRDGAWPRRTLLAERLLVACLAAAGRDDEAADLLVTVADVAARAGLARLLPDGGPYVIEVTRRVLDDIRADRARPGWPAVPASFLEAAVTAGSVHRV